MKNLFYLLLIVTALNLIACSKAGPGGNATIEGLCMHHSRVIPNDTVYIKYNATNLPGVDPSNYDNHVYADASGHYKFSGYKTGNYYLYGVGWDTAIGLGNPVTGGVGVKVTS